VRLGIVGTDDGHFVTEPAQFLVQEACLEGRAVGVRNANEVAENRYSKRAPPPRGEPREGRGLRGGPLTGE